MKFIERLRAEHPEAIAPEYMGGACGCPASYGYETTQPCDYPKRMAVFSDECRRCWEREDQNAR